MSFVSENGHGLVVLVPVSVVWLVVFLDCLTT